MVRIDDDAACVCAGAADLQRTARPFRANAAATAATVHWLRDADVERLFRAERRAIVRRRRRRHHRHLSAAAARVVGRATAAADANAAVDAAVELQLRSFSSLLGVVFVLYAFSIVL